MRHSTCFYMQLLDCRKLDCLCKQVASTYSWAAKTVMRENQEGQLECANLLHKERQLCMTIGWGSYSMSFKKSYSGMFSSADNLGTTTHVYFGVEWPKKCRKEQISAPLLDHCDILWWFFLLYLSSKDCSQQARLCSDSAVCTTVSQSSCL